MDGEAVPGNTHRNHCVIRQTSVSDEVEAVLLPNFAKHLPGACLVTAVGQEQSSDLNELTFHAL